MKTQHSDYFLIVVVAILLILGTLMIFNVSAFSSQVKFGIPYYFLNRHLLLGLIPGLILAFLAFKIPLELLKKWAPILLLMNIILMMLVFLPEIGVRAGGANRWLNLGFTTAQPSEFLKITFILYLAVWLSSRKILNVDRSGASKGVNQTFSAFLILIFLITLLLIFQPDVSTLGIIVLTGLAIYFLSGAPLWQLILIILVGATSLLPLIAIAPYRMARLLVFLKPETDPLGIGYQIKQALIAVGSGGIFGLGLGMSQQKFGFLPQTLNDAIFAIFAEETGFVGSFILILFFFLFFWRGFVIAKNAPDKFSQLLAFGITFWITIQTFFNISSMTGFLPMAGTSLPFISYGGSALISQLVGVGILLNISKQ